MEQAWFARVAGSLRERQRNILAWLKDAPPEERRLRLGEYSTDALAEHVHVLEGAIEQAEQGELGRCRVCHEHVETHWLETNYTTCVCLEHLTGEERSRLEAELELSQKVQQALLPQTLPDLPGWELAAFSRPASIVGGDYFDFLTFRDGSPAVIIADVMGKGMPASMLMASLQASLRIILPESESPDEVLTRTNRIFCHNIRLTKFVTIVVAQLDGARGVVRYANAGHHPPLLLAGAGSGGTAAGITELRPTGAAVGLVENATFAAAEVRIPPRGTLVLYTDGVVEAMNTEREEFGDDRLRGHLLSRRSLPPGDLLKSLRAGIADFTGGSAPSDDTTMIAVRKT